MIRLRRERDAAAEAPRADMIADLERLVRRGRVLPFLVPFLLFGGLGLGRLTSRALALPDGAPVRVVAEDRTTPEELELLSRKMADLRHEGRRTEDYIVLYRDHVEPVEAALQRRGVPASTARQVAWPLVEFSYRHSVDPATVVSIVLVESGGRPRATSPVGARGLMQVMPAWTGRVAGCGVDLYDVEDNLCYGTAILAWYLERFRGDERRALLGYNGCVLGTNTPDCFRYPDKVQGLRRQILQEWAAAGREALITAAAGAAAGGEDAT